MVKVRVQLIPEFGPERGEVKWSGAIESSYSEVVKVVQSKLKLKQMKTVTLYYDEGDPVTRRILPHGDLSEILQKDMKILVSLDQASSAAISPALNLCPGNETTMSEFALSVITIGGESFTVDVSPSETIGSVKTKIHESRGVKAGNQKLLLAEVELSDELGLEGSGVSATTPLQLVVESGFYIRLAGTSGPNSPRFGCRSLYTWQMKCDCGHMETWDHSDGYDFYSLSKQLTKKCPNCGADCLTKNAGDPHGVPTKFPA